MELQISKKNDGFSLSIRQGEYKSALELLKPLEGKENYTIDWLQGDAIDHRLFECSKASQTGCIKDLIRFIENAFTWSKERKVSAIILVDQNDNFVSAEDFSIESLDYFEVEKAESFYQIAQRDFYTLYKGKYKTVEDLAEIMEIEFLDYTEIDGDRWFWSPWDLPPTIEEAKEWDKKYSTPWYQSPEISVQQDTGLSTNTLLLLMGVGLAEYKDKKMEIKPSRPLCLYPSFWVGDDAIATEIKKAFPDAAVSTDILCLMDLEYWPECVDPKNVVAANTALGVFLEPDWSSRLDFLLEAAKPRVKIAAIVPREYLNIDESEFIKQVVRSNGGVIAPQSDGTVVIAVEKRSRG